MKKLFLVLITLMIVGICIPAVSAETITGSIHEPQYEVLQYPSTQDSSLGATYLTPNEWRIYFNASARYYPSQIVLRDVFSPQSEETFAATSNYRVYNGSVRYGTVKHGDFKIEYQKRAYDTAKEGGYYTVVINIIWNETKLASLADIWYIDAFSFKVYELDNVKTNTKILWADRSETPFGPATIGDSYSPPTKLPYTTSGMITYSMIKDCFEQNYVITTDEYGINIDLTRVINGKTNPSKIIVTDLSGEIVYESSEYIDINSTYEFPRTDLVVLLESYYNPDRRYEIYRGDPIDPTDPDGSGITVYVKNSQTGALIANANVAIDALIDGEYYSVTNRTEPSGIFSINLQPTGGGKPNPDSYRLIVTADGYNNPMPEINFTLGDYIKYFECFLDPIAGGPADENKTFIDFFVRDMSSNPISGATVKFGKYTLITNSAGYTVFEVDKNNNYSWTVSKSGYGALTGNAVIGDDPRHTINTVLAPVVTPTVTTPIPTSPPIGPTPTMTAPTGEHVSNWLEWFAAHFGMILGGGVEIGKIFMWLCFTVPVGVYVGKEAKAGAAGFMAGAGIVTLFFVLIGWVPIWLVVLLALIIGLLYAKVFNTPDNGGGR
jgi:hypothetical protein